MKSDTKQKQIFLDSEGNSWLSRNQKVVDSRPLPQGDPLLIELSNFNLPKGTKVLEIGCGHGRRLTWMRENLGFLCSGIEPSGEAVELAKSNGINAYQGTADELPFSDSTFDLLIFGFCLYLCDRNDLFRIAQEADRVLKDPGWLIIHDFYSPTPCRRPYTHYPGLFSHKMDYRTLFTWHPSYTCLNHQVRHHENNLYTDNPQEWVAISTIRKKAIEV
jgi:ubiquinone/menaquinone biosynthesis C-methylase UbiE